MKMWWAGCLMLAAAAGCGGSAPGPTIASNHPPQMAPTPEERCRRLLGVNYRGWTGPAATAPAPVPEPIHLTPQELRGSRVAGEKFIRPDDRTQMEMGRTHERTFSATFELCYAADGTPTRVSVIQPSCFQRYDETLFAALQGWRYAPQLVDGGAVPFCTSMTFIYQLR